MRALAAVLVLAAAPAARAACPPEATTATYLQRVDPTSPISTTSRATCAS